MFFQFVISGNSFGVTWETTSDELQQWAPLVHVEHEAGEGSAGVKTELGGNGLIIINYDNELVS